MDDQNYDEKEYSWEGTFKYNTGSPGYKWFYDENNKWKISDTPLKKRAQNINSTWNSLWRNIKRALNKSVEKKSPPFLTWLATGTNSTEVMQGISIMLNHVVSTGTIQPFQILSSFVDEHVTVQIKNLHEKKPCWFYLNQIDFLALIDEHVLAFPDLFFDNYSDNVVPTPKKAEHLKNTITRLRSSRILHDYSVVSYQYDENKGNVKIRLRDRVKLVHYKKGKICGCIPVPGKPIKQEDEKEEPESVLTPEVVVKSPNVSKCLEALSRIWQDHFTKSVLISAPPGSGKEVYATSIPFGNGRQTKNFMSISLATDNQSSLEKQLFGQKREDGTLEKGLIAEAENSALFLDEVHHPEDKAGIRASFLRTLESDEYFPVNSSKPESVGNVLFVLATSKTLEELDKIKPVDFWTRMTHVVTIKHPLDYKETKKHPCKSKILKFFFKFFWWERVEKYYKIDPTVPQPKTEHPEELLTYWQIYELVNEKKLKDMSGEFAKQLERASKKKSIGGLHKISIRGIRSMVSRMVSIAISNILQGHDPEENFSKELKNVIKEILTIANLEKAKKDIHGDEYQVTEACKLISKKINNDSAKK